MLDVIIGCVVGILSSMGFGGGSVLLLYLTLAKEIDHKVAAGTNLLFFLPCAILSTILYLKQKMIEWQTLWPLMVSSAIGAGVGAWAAMMVNAKIIRLGFGGLLLIIGLKDLFSGAKSPRRSAK